MDEIVVKINEYYQYQNNAVYKITDISISNNKVYLENINRINGKKASKLILDLDLFLTDIRKNKFKKVDFMEWNKRINLS